jgi:hypothetical protein
MKEQDTQTVQGCSNFEFIVKMVDAANPSLLSTILKSFSKGRNGIFDFPISVLNIAQIVQNLNVGDGLRNGIPRSLCLSQSSDKPFPRVIVPILTQVGEAKIIAYIGHGSMVGVGHVDDR